MKSDYYNYLLFTNAILIIFLPIFIVTGPFLPDIVVVFSTITLIFLLKKNKYLLFNKYIYFYLLWYFYILFTSLISNNVLLSLESSLFHFRFIFFSITLFFILEKFKKFAFYFTLSFLIFFAIIIFDGYYQFITGTNLAGFERNLNNFRLSGFFGEELKLGSYLSRMLPLLLALVIKNIKNKIYQNILIFLLIILTDVLVYLTGERTAFLNILLLFFIFLIILQNKKILRLMAASISLILVTYLTTIDSSLKNRLDQTLDQTGISSLIKSESNDKKSRLIIFSDVHESHYITSYRIFKDNFIFGIGPKMYREICEDEKYKFDKHSCATHPHNTYVQLFLETGIFGAIPVLIIFFMILYIFIKKIYSNYFKFKNYYDDYFFLLIASFFINLWPLVPSGNFFNNWLNVIYFLPLGFVLSHLKSLEYNKSFKF
jgi:O-antigen ligase